MEKTTPQLTFDQAQIRAYLTRVLLAGLEAQRPVWTDYLAAAHRALFPEDQPIPVPQRGFPVRAKRLAPRLVHTCGIVMEQVPPLERLCQHLGDIFRLDGNARTVIGFFARLETQAVLRRVFDMTVRGPADGLSRRIVRIACDLTEAESRRLIGPKGLLLNIGLLGAEGGYLHLTHLAREAVRLKTVRPEAVKAVFLGHTPQVSTTLKDHDHLGEQSSIALRLLETVQVDGKPMGPVLLYGDPGTGKTEFALCLAKALNLTPVMVGEAVSKGSGRSAEPCRTDRLASLKSKIALARTSRSFLLIVDEAEDLFLGSDSGLAVERTGSKVYLNRLIETLDVPTVMIVNHADYLSEALTRRMSCAVRFGPMGPTQRMALVIRRAEARGVRITDDEAARLSAISAPPALVDRAIETAGRLGNDIEAGRQVMTGLMRAMGNPVQSDPRTDHGVPFDPALSRADMDLADLADRVAAHKNQAISFCLSGPPGAGKSAFARYLAGRMGLEVIQKRSSDLISKWVGESEQKIAEAFQEAEDRRAFLIFDEADSLLASRGQAEHSHDIRQVNEMLSWMERHPYPFACTTNLMERLDPASLRRFTFKINFEPIGEAEIVKLYTRLFGHEPLPGLGRIEGLSPADLKLVKRQCEIMGVAGGAAVLALLRAEAARKPGARRTIGFAI